MTLAATGIVCPHCRHEVLFQGGLLAQQILLAAHLQSEHLGAEIECHHCRTIFLYRGPNRVPVLHPGSHDHFGSDIPRPPRKSRTKTVPGTRSAAELTAAGRRLSAG